MVDVAACGGSSRYYNNKCQGPVSETKSVEVALKCLWSRLIITAQCTGRYILRTVVPADTPYRNVPSSVPCDVSRY